MPDGRPGDGRRGAAFWTATVLGVGLVPVAPGTFGSAVAALACWGLATSVGIWAVPALAVAATAVGMWASAAVARSTGKTDPGCVVIDEVAGQAVALAFVPPTVGAWVAGFLLFRLFDIMKPPPIRRIERLPGGAGIMMDDLVAGAFANILVRAVVVMAPGVLGGS